MWWLLACAGEKPPGDPAWDGLYDADPLNPVPSAELVVDGHVAIPDGALPVPEGGTPLPVDRLNWRTGFSPVQPSVWRSAEPLDAASGGGQGALGGGGPANRPRLQRRSHGGPLPRGILAPAGRIRSLEGVAGATGPGLAVRGRWLRPSGEPGP